jgi:hypothetical protein
VPAALPRLVAHADWSIHPRKRWLARAVLGSDGRYCAIAPEPVGPLETFWADFDRASDGPAFVGFDFPIGLPRAYAEPAGIHGFVAELANFGRGRFADFYEVAREAQEISLARPFYPDRVGGRRRSHLLDGLGLSEHADLLRRCERRTANRNAACALFWTLGGNQVGKAAIAGWRDLLAPALRSGADLAIWPFHGGLGDLLAKHRLVVAETYPGEVYRHLGLDLRRGKRRQEVRRNHAARLMAWAEDAGVDLEPALALEIEDGFGSDRAGEDRFDAVVGLLGMLNVVLGYRPAGEPDDPVVRRIEGWILGQPIAPSG